ncbi:MAG: molybdopterin oxidoreductase family protein [Hyphomicrobiales bacterium]|nr:molybdopterin oxidoreductase family protein [Hyphomicrobiales bacterium]
MSLAERRFSTCPHDCPSVCALEVEVSDGRIGRVRGAKDHPYTLGVICEKVARYAERIHHPDRLLHPMQRVGAKGDGEWRRISWEAALDETAEALLKAEARSGAEAVWPYYYAGTMGLVQRDGINRLRHAKRYSRQHSTICISLSWSGWLAGVGAVRGVDSREMADADLIVIWGTNPVHTQVNVMTQVAAARKRGARLAVVDVYDTATMKQADIPVLIRPGTDGALACAVMHCLFRDGAADWEYMRRYADDPDALAAHLADKTPAWAAAITGMAVEEIEAFARAIGSTKRAFFRIGYGFTRSRNGASNMHAVSCIPAVTGAWAHRGGGALHSGSGLFRLDKSLIEGHDAIDSATRQLDQSRIGAILCGEAADLHGGPPVAALFIQNTNPVSVCPEQALVKRGFSREDLFTCVHEQFMTETAEMADIVLPATMFLEHDDIYQAAAHPSLMFGPKLVEAPGECRSNHWVLAELAKRVGAEHRGFHMTEREIIDETLKASGRGDLAQIERDRWIDCTPRFEDAHFLNGFAHADRRFHFRVDWARVPFPSPGALAHAAVMPALPDHWAATEEADAAHPFRLVTAPARTFLNSSFTETPGSVGRERRPEALLHPDDASVLAVGDGDPVTLGNARGEVRLHARLFDGARRGVVIAEGIWPNKAHAGGAGINTLVGADASAPFGGAAFHDTSVWIRKGWGECSS